MNQNLVLRNEANLPATISELHKFIFVGKEQLKAHRAKIRAIDQVSEGHAAKQAALEDGQHVAEILLDAESKLGELLAVIPKHGKRAEYGSSGGTIPSIPFSHP